MHKGLCINCSILTMVLLVNLNTNTSKNANLNTNNNTDQYLNTKYFLYLDFKFEQPALISFLHFFMDSPLSCTKFILGSCSKP